MPNSLFLRLEGPLQSWGERGRWSIRDSAPEPTKSGVIGLIACAMGINTNEPIKTLSESLQMGVRIDRCGTRITDYHTIGGGADEPMLLTAEGKPKKSSGAPHTEISYRDYLCDASFLIALQGDPERIANIAQALQNPQWVIFLGRKSCPPTRPVFNGTGDFPDLQSALCQHDWPDGVQELMAVLECPPTIPNAVRRRDHLVNLTHRIYQPRYTQTIILSPETMKEA